MTFIRELLDHCLLSPPRGMIGANEPHSFAPRVNAGAKNRPPKGKGGPRLGSVDKDWCCHERDSMTANHVEHEIATFPRITGRTAGPACREASLCAISRHLNRATANQTGRISGFHSMISSASSRNESGILNPIALAVLRFTISSKRAGS